MNGARNVARLRCSRAFTAKFRPAARVPNSKIGVTQSGHYVGDLDQFFGIDADVWLRRRYLRNLFGERQLRVFPRLQPAVEVGILIVTDGIQRPDKATRPTAAFVVVDHKVRFGGET